MSRDEVRAVDQWAIQEIGAPGVVLMENAGLGLLRAILDMREDSGKVAVFAGKGNNGGDGFVACRHLWNLGVDVVAYVLGNGEERSRPGSDAAVNLSVIERMGVPIVSLLDEEDVSRIEWVHFSLVVDALLGTGLNSAPRGLVRTLIEAMNRSGIPILAVDIPSGLDADSGCPLDICVKAVRTVTFGVSKIGFDNPDSAEYTGPVEVIDISLPKQLLEGPVDR